MPWTQTDTSFKKLQNKRITTSTGKGIDEEKGASSLELYLPDVKTDLIPGTPPGASTSVLAYTGAIGQTFAVDTSVPSNLTWFATSGYGNTTTANDGSAGSENQRLGDWISDKYDAFGTVSGSGYEVKVYDKDSNLITKADPSDWLFDYQTGILVFNSASTAYGAVTSSGPFRVVGYRYIGQKGVISGSYGGSGFTTYTLGDLLVGAGSTLIKFPVGSDNYVLTADSSQPSGLRWAVGGGAGLTLNGLTASTQYFVTGTSGSGFNISSSGATHTFNIPIAGAGATGLISTLAQTIAGQKTFTSAIIGDLSGIATTAGFATTADYAHQAGYAITSGFATTSGYAYQSGYAITSGLATTSTYSHQSGYAITSGLATTATYSHQSGYGITAGFATTSANINVSNASTGIFFPVLSNTSSSTSGIAASVNDFFSFNAANGAFGATSINIFTGQSYSIGGNSVLSSSSLGTGVTNSSLTALGIITTGTWSGSTITAYYGGTGLTSITAGNAFLSSNSAGTALTYRTFSAGTGLTLSVTPNNVEFSAVTTGFITGSGTSSFVPIFTGGTGLTDSIMQQYDSTIIVSGQIKAITKSFKIPHPLDSKKVLEHGSLEGPEHGAYQRGSGSGYDQVEIFLPNYWSSLVENNYSIIITSKCNYNLYVSQKNSNSFIIRRIGSSIFSKKYIEFDYFVIGERKDTKIDVEQYIN